MPIVVVMIGGLFWRRAGAAASLVTLAIGFPVGLTAFVANELLGLIDIQFLYLTGIMLVLNLVLFVGWRCSPRPHPRR